MRIEVPAFSLVVLVGPSGAGKSSFARAHFKATEVLSSDTCRGLVADDENDQGATADAFEVLGFIAAKRLKNRLLTVIDATNVRPEDRKNYLQLARQYDCLATAIVLDLPEAVCQTRNRDRPERSFGSHVVRNQVLTLRRGVGRGTRALEREGFRKVWILRSEEEVESVTIERTPLWNDRRADHGPFDIVGDVHGCLDELVELLERLGYSVAREADRAEGDWGVLPPSGERRTLVFLGDLVDRGPKSPGVVRLVMRAVADGVALAVPGNHDVKLVRKLSGRSVQLTHGLAETMEQLDREPDALRGDICTFLDGLVSHYVLDGGKLVVAHAGLKEEYQGRASGRVREFCLYGETTGETDEFGLPVRYNWAAEYRGSAMVVYGHTPVPEPEWLNGTTCIDTGCVFGGHLTALRYPERELVSVPARSVYAVPARPFLDSHSEPDQHREPCQYREQAQHGEGLSGQHRADDILDLADVCGKRLVDTRLRRAITISAEHASAALEVMSRFAVDPRWLIYLPPTMSPSDTTQRAGLLEHPAEAFSYYRDAGIESVVCEEKHMGSRAVVVLCRDEETARRRFGVTSGDLGAVYTRTGRPFFTDAQLGRAMLERITKAAQRSGVFDQLESDWLCLDCELMPWSAKAQELIRGQYAATAAAGLAALTVTLASLDRASSSLTGDEVQTLRNRFAERLHGVERYRDSYRRYCWPVESIDDLQLAPFHLLASEGHVHVDRDHLWHLERLGKLAEVEPLVVATDHRVVDLTDDTSVAQAEGWWHTLTERGGEGMVVKPFSFLARGRRGLLQPAVKCRGPEYLRLIYGPEYLMPEHLERLRSRSVKRKRSLALSELALGVEALERFVRREPLRRVHECVFGVLALESEPVDPRL